MNPRIVGCLFLSILVALLAAGAAVAAGWGFLLALAVYSAAGSITLVVSSAAAALLLDLRPAARMGPVPEAEKTACV